MVFESLVKKEIGPGAIPKDGKFLFLTNVVKTRLLPVPAL